MKKRISVCIATYNGEKYIKEQIMSILCQLNDNDEVIVSDDKSTDNTLEIIKSIKDDRIKIIINNSEKGYTSNFENALKHASGEFIFLSDQDDIWLPNKVNISMSFLKEYDILISNAIVVDSNKNVIEESFFNIIEHHSGFWKNIYKFTYLGCCMCFKRTILQKALPFPPKRKLCTHDNWLFIIGAFFFKMKIIDEPLILYRRHGRNISTGAEKYFKRNSIWFMIKYRIYLLYNIIIRR